MRINGICSTYIDTKSLNKSNKYIGKGCGGNGQEVPKERFHRLFNSLVIVKLNHNSRL